MFVAITFGDKNAFQNRRHFIKLVLPLFSCAVGQWQDMCWFVRCGFDAWLVLLAACVTCYWDIRFYLNNIDTEPSPESLQQRALRLCRGAWHSESLIKSTLIYSVSYFNLGVLGTLFGGDKSTNTPWRRDCFDCMFLQIYCYYKEVDYIR